MSMSLEQAKAYVVGEIARIEAENPVGELRPWSPDACRDAREHWGFVQMRIALEKRDMNRACLAGLDITPPERTDAQNAVLEAARQRRMASRAANLARHSEVEVSAA